jgi:hypothetical protein
MKQVWYVQGEHNEGREIPTLFDTKLAAELYVQHLYPDEDISKQYSRIMYRDVLTVADMTGGLNE